jgi:hypothetical protein
MGISPGNAKILLKEATRKPFSGRLLSLGRQDINFTHAELLEMSRSFGFPLRSAGAPTLSHKPDFAGRGRLSPEYFFSTLGFAHSESLDCSDFEHADFVFDLNRSDLPKELIERFDVIYDGGTIEHVFHVPQALHNLFRMLRVGGRIIHGSPSSNHMDHGFYMFSPTLFWDFYCANRFEINTFQIIRGTPNAQTDPWEIYDYTPGCLDDVSFGGLDDGLYGINCIVTKLPHSTGNVIPQQGMYLKTWTAAKSKQDITKSEGAANQQILNSYEERPVAASATGPAAASPPPQLQRFKAVLRAVPPVYHLSRIAWRGMKRLKTRLRSFQSRGDGRSGPTQAQEAQKKGIRLKVVARY